MIHDRSFEADGLGEEYHGDRLAGTGGVADDSASAAAIATHLGHTLHCVFDSEILLIPWNLLLLVAEDDEPMRQFEEAFWTKQAVDGAVLVRGIPEARVPEIQHLLLLVPVARGEQLLDDLMVWRRVDEMIEGLSVQL